MSQVRTHLHSVENAFIAGGAAFGLASAVNSLGKLATSRPDDDTSTASCDCSNCQYAPSASTLEKLHGGSSRTWKLDTETEGYVAVGPLWASSPIWYQAAPGSRADLGSDHDRWTFGNDGTLSHTTNGGCAVKTEYAAELGEVDESLDLDNPQGNLFDNTYKNFPISDYTGSWEIVAPGGLESIQLSGAPAHFALYTGTPIYQLSFISDSKILLRAIDSYARKWWILLIAVDSD